MHTLCIRREHVMHALCILCEHVMHALCIRREHVMHALCIRCGRVMLLLCAPLAPCVFSRAGRGVAGRRMLEDTVFGRGSSRREVDVQLMVVCTERARGAGGTGDGAHAPRATTGERLGNFSRVRASHRAGLCTFPLAISLSTLVRRSAGLSRLACLRLILTSQGLSCPQTCGPDGQPRVVPRVWTPPAGLRHQPVCLCRSVGLVFRPRSRSVLGPQGQGERLLPLAPLRWLSAVASLRCPWLLRLPVSLRKRDSASVNSGRQFLCEFCETMPL